MIHTTLLFVDVQSHFTHGIECLLHVFVILVIRRGDLQQFVELQRILTDTFDRREKKTIEFVRVPIGQQPACLNEPDASEKSTTRFDVLRRN